MKYNPGRLGVVGLTSIVLLGACGESVSDSHTAVEAMTIEEAGDGFARITLTERAMERLDIQTVPVEQSDEWLVVPSDAVFVDETGTFWLYTNPEPMVYVRHEIGVVDDDGERAFLSNGPDVGTPVVTVGVPELYGAETGIGH